MGISKPNNDVDFNAGSRAKSARRKEKRKEKKELNRRAAALPPPPGTRLTREEREIEKMMVEFARIDIKRRVHTYISRWEARIRAARKEKTKLAKEKRVRKEMGEELYPGQIWIDQQRRSMRIAQEIESGERYDQASDSEPQLSEEEVMTDSDDDETDHVYETPAMPGKGYAKYGPGGEFGKRGGGGEDGAGCGQAVLV